MGKKKRERSWHRGETRVTTSWSKGLLSVQSSADDVGWRARLSGPPERWVWEPPGGPHEQEQGWDLNDGWRKQCRRGPPLELLRTFERRGGADERSLTPSLDAKLGRLLGERSQLLLGSIEPARLQGVGRLAPRHRLRALWLLRHDETGRLLRLLDAQPGLFLFRLALEDASLSAAALADFDKGIQEGRRSPQLKRALLEAWSHGLASSLEGLVTASEAGDLKLLHPDEVRPALARSFRDRIGSHSALIARLPMKLLLPLSALRLPLPAALTPAEVTSLRDPVGALRLLTLAPRLTATGDERWSKAASWLALHAHEFRKEERMDGVRGLEQALARGAPAPRRALSLDLVMRPSRGLAWGLPLPPPSMPLPQVPDVPCAFRVRRLVNFGQLVETERRFAHCHSWSEATDVSEHGFAVLSPRSRPLLVRLKPDRFGRWQLFDSGTPKGDPLNPLETSAIARWLQSLPVEGPGLPS